MRKLFYLFALIALCSCGPATINNRTEQDILEEFEQVTHFTYKNHRYISFTIGYRMGIVHDPNCHCHGK